MNEKAPKNPCDLCVLEKLTKWYYEDDTVAILDCIKCNMPMVVLKRHTMEPTAAEHTHMTEKAREVFEDKRPIAFRTNQRTILDHKHWHILGTTD